MPVRTSLFVREIILAGLDSKMLPSDIARDLHGQGFQISTRTIECMRASLLVNGSMYEQSHEKSGRKEIIIEPIEEVNLCIPSISG